MKTPVVFLDIDEVLNHEASWMAAKDRVEAAKPEDFPQGVAEFKDGKLYSVYGISPTRFFSICPKAIATLNAITDPTQACIVISSTWRLGRSANVLAFILRWHGMKAPVLGVTPQLWGERRYIENDFSTRYNQETHPAQAPRGYEILWSVIHNQIERFVILDDSADMRMLSAWLVNCSVKYGLLDWQAEVARTILSQKRTLGEPFAFTVDGKKRVWESGT